MLLTWKGLGWNVPRLMNMPALQIMSVLLLLQGISNTAAVAMGATVRQGLVGAFIWFSVPFSCVSWLFTISACFRNVSGSCSALSFSFFRFSRPALSSATEATHALWLFSAVARSLVAAPSRASSFITSPVRFSMSSRHCAIWGSIAAA